MGWNCFCECDCLDDKEYNRLLDIEEDYKELDDAVWSLYQDFVTGTPEQFSRSLVEFFRLYESTYRKV